MKKAVIFDLDGTLADTLESIAYCTNRALADCGFCEIGETEAFKRMVGDGARMLVVRALRRAGDTEGMPLASADADGWLTEPVHTEAAVTRYRYYFEKGCMYQVKPYDGILALLKALKERNLKLAVFSNKPHENTKYVITSLFGEDTFDVIMGQRKSVPKKPAPDGLLAILETLGVSREEVLYVGDSSVDMDTGRAAGVKTLGVLWGFREKEELLAHGADALLGSPRELLAFL